MSSAPKSMDTAPDRPAYIFHSPDEASEILRRPMDALTAFVDFIEAKSAMFRDPASEAFHLWHLMPPPSYEYAWGLGVPLDATYRTPFPVAPDGMLVLRLGKGARAEVRFGDVVLVAQGRDEDVCMVKFGEERFRVAGKYLRLTVRGFAGKTYFGANGTLVATLPGELPAAPTFIRTKRGHCHLIAAQSLRGEGRFLHFDVAGQSDESLVEFKDERNPFRFDWGLRTCTMLNIFIALAVARDVATGAREADVDPKVRPLLARIRAVADDLGALRYVFDGLRKWPHWRPCAGLYPETGMWDRNSFTNGTVPALFALLARMYGCSGDDDVVERFHDRGTSFMNSMTRGDFLAFPARDEDHWIKRSANHGLIMLSTYMIAAKLLGQTDRDDVRAIDLILGGALHRLHQDGSFCEGVAYEFFGLGYLLPYVKLFGLDHVYDEERSVASLTKLLGLTYDWISLSHSASGDVFANFGDNFTQRIRRTSHFAFIQAHADRRLDAPAPYGEQFDEFFSLAPSLDVSPRAGARLETRVYPINQTYLAAAFGETGRRRLGLFVIGSTLQRTHNHNHDCGGFAFYWDEDGVAIPKSRREAYLNNAVGVMRGGQIAPHRAPRNYSGAVRELHASDMEARVVSRVDFTLTYGDGKPLAWLEREFLLRPLDQVPLVIRTRLQAALDVTPFLAFQSSGFSFRPSKGKWVRGFVRRRDGGWETLTPEIRNDRPFFLAPDWATGDQEQEFLTCFGRGDIDDSALVESCVRSG